jgi:putative membrane protein
MEQKSGSTIKRFLQGWAITTFAVLVAATMLPGIHYSQDWRVLLLASLLLGVLNAIVRPILMLIALPLLVITLGLFMLVINALLLLLVGRIVHGFEVAGFGTAVLGSLIISVISILLNTLTGTGNSRIQVRRGRRDPRPPRRHDDGGGPVIDV